MIFFFFLTPKGPKHRIFFFLIAVFPHGHHVLEDLPIMLHLLKNNDYTEFDQSKQCKCSDFVIISNKDNRNNFLRSNYH